eukprot:scpid85516/ scgid12121/ Ras-related protein Rab-37
MASNSHTPVGQLQSRRSFSSTGRRYQRRSDCNSTSTTRSGDGSLTNTPTSTGPGILGVAGKNGKADVAEPSTEPHEAVKVILLGDSSVGKTCLMVRFNDGAFHAGNFISTVGIDFRTKVMTLDGTQLHLQIWDTAGQERFRSITASYYHDADAILLVYDMTSWSSFEHLNGWLSTVRDLAPKDVSLLLVANKSDLSSSKRVNDQAAAELAQEHKVCFLEVSAKTGDNVSLAFEAVARSVLANRALKAKDDAGKGKAFDLGKYVEENSTKSECSC